MSGILPSPGNTTSFVFHGDTPTTWAKNEISHNISTLKTLYKQHTEEDAQFARQHWDFEQACAEIRSQTDEDLSHAAALLIQVGEVEQMTNAVLAQVQADKMVITQVRQEIVSGSPESTEEKS